MQCYACDQSAKRQCARCAKSYCLAHGGRLCAACLDPLGAAPSSAVFRTSLFALFAASVLALWLLIRPPSLPGEGSSAVQPRATATFAPATTEAVSSGSATPPATPAPSPEATPTPPAPEPQKYTVQEGDTWYGIAGAFAVRAEDLAAVNGKTLDDFIHVGDVLVIPGH